MVSYYADPNGMLDSSADLQNATNKLQTDITELEQSVTNFLAHNQGQAIDGYDAAQARWRAAMARMQAALARSGPQVESMLANYHQVDRMGAASFGAH